MASSVFSFSVSNTVESSMLMPLSERTQCSLKADPDLVGCSLKCLRDGLSVSHSSCCNPCTWYDRPALLHTDLIYLCYPLHVSVLSTKSLWNWGKPGPVAKMHTKVSRRHPWFTGFPAHLVTGLVPSLGGAWNVETPLRIPAGVQNSPDMGFCLIVVCFVFKIMSVRWRRVLTTNVLFPRGCWK